MYEALLEFPEQGGGGGGGALRKNQSIDGFYCHATKKHKLKTIQWKSPRK